MTSAVFVSEDLDKSVTQISFDEVDHPYQVIVYSIIESNPSLNDSYGLTFIAPKFRCAIFCGNIMILGSLPAILL